MDEEKKQIEWIVREINSMEKERRQITALATLFLLLIVFLIVVCLIGCGSKGGAADAAAPAPLPPAILPTDPTTIPSGNYSQLYQNPSGLTYYVQPTDTSPFGEVIAGGNPNCTGGVDEIPNFSIPPGTTSPYLPTANVTIYAWQGATPILPTANETFVLVSFYPDPSGTACEFVYYAN